MVLYLIGLGLCNEKDITVKGLEYIKQSDYRFNKIRRILWKKNNFSG